MKLYDRSGLEKGPIDLQGNWIQVELQNGHTLEIVEISDKEIAIWTDTGQLILAPKSNAVHVIVESF